MDLETHPVAEAVNKVLPVSGPCDDVPGDSVDLDSFCALPDLSEGRLFGLEDSLVDGPLLLGGGADDECPRDVGTIPPVCSAHINGDEIASPDLPRGDPGVRISRSGP